MQYAYFLSSWHCLRLRQKQSDLGGARFTNGKEFVR